MDYPLYNNLFIQLRGGYPPSELGDDGSDLKTAGLLNAIVIHKTIKQKNQKNRIPKNFNTPVTNSRTVTKIDLSPNCFELLTAENLDIKSCNQFNKDHNYLQLTVALLLGTGVPKGSKSAISTTRWLQRLQIPPLTPT